MHRSALLFLAPFPLAASAIDGQLDEGFGNRFFGRSTFFIDRPSGNLEDFAIGGVELADGSVIVVGSANALGANVDPVAVSMVKMTRGGQTDIRFGNTGKVIGDRFYTALFSAIERPATATASQKIVVLGMAHALHNGEFTPEVSQFNLDGTPDTQFGVQGTAFLGQDMNPAVSRDNCHMALQPDGKLLVACSVRRSATDGVAVVFRLNANGSSDTAFGGGNGRTEVQFHANAGTGVDSAGGIAVTSEGKIRVGLSVQKAADTFSLGVASLTATGATDGPFGGNDSGHRLFFNVCGSAAGDDVVMRDLRVNDFDDTIFVGDIVASDGSVRACMGELDGGGFAPATFAVKTVGSFNAEVQGCRIFIDRGLVDLACSSSGFGPDHDFDQLLIRRSQAPFGSEISNFVPVIYDIRGQKDDVLHGILPVQGDRLLLLGGTSVANTPDTDTDFSVARVILHDGIFEDGFGGDVTR